MAPPIFKSIRTAKPMSFCNKTIAHSLSNEPLGLFRYIALAFLAAASLACFSSDARAQVVAGAQLSNLHSFGAAGDGEWPVAGVVFDTHGNIYGTTAAGGASGDGIIYTVPLGGSYGVMDSFTDANGANPQSELTALPGGGLCGTLSAKAAGSGALFQIKPTSPLTTLHQFTDFSGNGSYMNSDGATPLGGLTLGSDGNLYGTGSVGGLDGDGTIFRVSLDGTFTKLHDFGMSDGATPDSTLVAYNGALYGVTQNGGANGTGTIFKITQSGDFTTLYSFSADPYVDAGNADGANPCGPLVVDASGTIYGTACNGGAADYGTLFKLSQQGEFTSLHSFARIADDGYVVTSGGVHPRAITLGPDGNIYGITEYGGLYGTGTIFRESFDGTFSLIYNFGDGFSDPDGVYPLGSIVFGPDGGLYGTTTGGGANQEGTLYKIDISGLTAPASTRFDFNKDGHADLLWYNSGSGDVSVWDMDDETVLSYGSSFTQLAPATGWVPVAAPDVNGDGYPDLLWWNKNTGELSVWTLNNTTVTNYGAEFGQISDTDWKPVAVADNAGSNWTLVFQNTATGDISRWLMDGTTIKDYGVTINSLGPNSSWQIVGAPDLDGDGKSDLLFWNSNTGEVSWWECDLEYSQVNSFNGDFAQISDTSWHLVGSEDTNGDGQPDLVWWNADSGTVSRWLLNGTNVTNYGGSITQVSDTTWQPTAIR